MEFLSIGCAPHEDHRLQTVLSCDNRFSVVADAEGHDVIGVAKLSFSLLFTTLFFLLAATKDRLSALRRIEDDAKSGSHVDRLHVLVVEEILTSHVALVSMYELDLVMNVWW